MYDNGHISIYLKSYDALELERDDNIYQQRGHMPPHMKTDSPSELGQERCRTALSMPSDGVTNIGIQVMESLDLVAVSGAS